MGVLLTTLLIQTCYSGGTYPEMEFEGFKVEVAGGSTMPCNMYISGMKLTLGRHDLAQDFYVMDLPAINIILGV